MNQSKTFPTAVLLFCVTLCFSAGLVSKVYSGVTGKIAGRVVDAQNRNPLPGATVLLEGTTMGAAADPNGYYTILQVPPGTYNVAARMLGYQPVKMSNVAVRVDLTSKLDFRLESTNLEVDAVYIVAERPLVVKDLTASATKIDASEIEDLPNVVTVTDALQLMPGVVGEGENLHVRGGRAGETVFLVDGVPINDPLFSSEVVSVNKYAVGELELLTGGFNAEYGNAQSGVVNIVTRTGGPNYSGRFAYFSDHAFGSGQYPSDVYNVDNPLALSSNTYFEGEGEGIRSNSLNTDRWEFSLGGPEPITDALLPALGFQGLKGKVKFYLSGNAEMSDGYLPNENQGADLISADEAFDRTPEVQEAGEAREVRFVNPRNVRHPFLQEFLGFDWGGRFSDNLDYNARLSYRISNQINASLSYVGSQFWQDEYRHTYRFQPDHTQQTEGNNYSMVLNWSHNLSTKTFYQARLGLLKNFRFQYPGVRNGIKLTPEFMNSRIGDGDDSMFPDNAMFNLANPNDPLNFDTADERAGKADPRQGAFEFGYNDDSTWGKHTTRTYTAKVDVTSQVNRHNQVQAGFEWKYNDLHQEQIDFGGNKVPTRRLNPSDQGPYVTSGALRDFYDRYPNTGAIYVQDKIEFQSLIMNVGLRYDRFDPGAQVSETGEAFLTGATEQTPVNTKDYFSPRFGISHPITDRSRFYFFYGRFVQIPTLRELYRRQNRFRVFQNQLNTYGNADLEAEETISYEVGFDHQFTNDIKVGVTGFYKDIRNQINLSTFGPEAAPFRKLVNRDFGQDRGFEFDLVKRFRNYFAANINYTLMWATTRSSTFDRGIGALGVRAFPQLQEAPSDWDQRHTINAHVQFEIPEGKGFRLFGLNIDRLSLITFWRYGSGVPFTIHEDADPNATINSARLPHFSVVDLRFRKDFRIFNEVFTTFYVDMNNVLDRRNVLFLFDDAEHRCVECQLPDPVTGETVIKRFEHGNLEGDGNANDLDPEQLGSPRQILLGFGVRF
jgi:outer membrane receptor protein involved in Fe transport